MPRTDEVATDATDGAVAEGQPALPPPEDMGADPPPAGASPRLLRIKKKLKPGFVAPASATAATAGSDARPSAPPITKKHAFQHVEMIREDLKGSFRIRSTEEDIDSVRYFQPADPTATPTEGGTQRGSTQRGSTPKFTQTEALKVHGVILDDLRLPPGAPTGNTCRDRVRSGVPPKGTARHGPRDRGGPMERANPVPCGTDARSPPKAPPGAAGTTFGSAFSAAVMSFEYVEEPDNGARTPKGFGPTVVIRLTSGENGSAQSDQHGYSLHGSDIEFAYVPHPTALPDRIHIVRKLFRSDTPGVVQIDLPVGSGKSIVNFLHVFHNLPGHPPNWATLSDLSVVTGGLSVDGVYKASFWETDWAIQSTDPDDAPSSRAARPAQAANQRACFTATGDAHTGSASLTCYVNQSRASIGRHAICEMS